MNDADSAIKKGGTSRVVVYLQGEEIIIFRLFPSNFSPCFF